PQQTALSDWLKVNGADLDIVLLSRPDVAELCLHQVRANTTAKIAYYGHDLHFSRLAAEALLNGNPAQRRAAKAMQTAELAIWQAADLVLYPSEEEAAVVRALAPSACVRAVIPYAFEAADMPRACMTECDAAGPPDTTNHPLILFVAGFGHPPN